MFLTEPRLTMLGSKTTRWTPLLCPRMLRSRTFTLSTPTWWRGWCMVVKGRRERSDNLDVVAADDAVAARNLELQSLPILHMALSRVNLPAAAGIRP